MQAVILEMDFALLHNIDKVRRHHWLDSHAQFALRDVDRTLVIRLHESQWQMGLVDDTLVHLSNLQSVESREQDCKADSGIKQRIGDVREHCTSGLPDLELSKSSRHLVDI